tara:strand:+ start:3431 stop:4399 length:969 start_codon:yes stop_codon:yes gene_type:complete
MAVAYVSASGFNLVKTILDGAGVGEIRLVADTKDGITHPKALESAINSGWKVRVVDSLVGTFHPKLYVGAAAFDDHTGVSGLSLAIVGSPNISNGGFVSNGECAFWSTHPHSRDSAARAWLECWNVGTPLTTAKLREYEKFFALRNRKRTPADLVALGITDKIPESDDEKPKKGVSPPRPTEQAVSEAVATIAWAGLQSFTGEYNLQLEFPKEAGLVLKRVFAERSEDALIDLACSDSVTRTFRYRYYDHNGMFRLNIPNSAPLVDWARENRKGIAYVEYDEETGSLYFEILPDGQTMLEIIRRSLALGSWGKTSTRLYGWY